MKLLVLTIRGLSATAIGPYGNRWIQTFAFDTLAANGVVFDTHLSAHPDPVLARNVWRTGLHQFAPVSPNSAHDLLQSLRAKGTHTHLISDAPDAVLGSFAEGWHLVTRANDRGSIIQAARNSLDAPPEGDWMLWVDIGALIPPWHVPEEFLEAYFAPPPVEEDEEDDSEIEMEEEDEESDYFDEEEGLEPLLDPPQGRVDPQDDLLFIQLQKTHAAAVSHLDSLLGELLDGLADDVTLLLTADHGFALGEHGAVGLVEPNLHAEVVHVPLILLGPGCRAGKHVRVLSSSLDLAPTIAELAGARLENTHGKSLVPLLGLEEPTVHDYLCLGWQIGEGVVYALRTPDWYLLLNANTDKAQMFSKPDDRFEVLDLRHQEMEYAERLEQVMRAYIEASKSPGSFVPPALPVLEETETA